MIEKEKRKPELKPSWLRNTGCLLIVIGIAIWLTIPLFRESSGLLSVIQFFGGLIAAYFGLGCLLRYSIQGRPTLNQIRQNPDNPLIVQQWNGREWIDTLDLQSVVKDIQKIDSSQY